LTQPQKCFEYNCRVNTQKTIYLFLILLLLLQGLSLLWQAPPVKAEGVREASLYGALDSPALQQATSTEGPAQQPISPVQTVTPNENGSVTHVVKYGENLIDIATAYGLTLNDLYARNRSLDPNKPVYYEGQVLIIRAAFTPTPFMTVTYTPRPPTNTPRPTRTPRPTQTATAVRSPVPTRTFTATPAYQIPTLDDLGENRTMIAYVFIAVSTLGLVILVFTSFLPGKKGR
jgi:LysM repeat protein